MKTLGFMARLFRRSPPKPIDPPVTFDETGFGRPGPDGFTAAWSDVRRITGYKIDMLTWDEIRMDFYLAIDLTVIVTEESPGFADFMREVEHRFPSVSGWHSKVSQPVFAPCTTVLYEAPNHALQPTPPLRGGSLDALGAAERTEIRVRLD